MSAAERVPVRFPFRLGGRSRPILLLFGVRQRNAYVDLGTSPGADVDAHFGFYRLQTPISNIRRYRIEGPWHWVKAIGLRRGIVHGDISFGGTHRGGFRIEFRERVKWGLLRVPALYVTVEDTAGFAAALDERGIPGEDVRRNKS